MYQMAKFYREREDLQWKQRGPHSLELRKEGDFLKVSLRFDLRIFLGALAASNLSPEV